MSAYHSYRGPAYNDLPQPDDWDEMEHPEGVNQNGDEEIVRTLHESGATYSHGTKWLMLLMDQLDEDASYPRPPCPLTLPAVMTFLAEKKDPKKMGKQIQELMIQGRNRQRDLLREHVRLEQEGGYRSN